MVQLQHGRYPASLGSKKAAWAAIYAARLGLFGTTAVFFPMGDDNHEAGDRTTLTSTGEEQVTLTYSEALTSWDTLFHFEGPSQIPIITANGTDEEGDTPGIAAFSTTGAFSIVVWVRMTDATSSTIVAKWDATTATPLREYRCGFDSSDRPFFEIYDESENASVGRRDGTANVEGDLQHLAFTFDGGTDAAGVSVYLNGEAVDDADVVDDAGFANSEDLATVLQLYYLENSSGAKADFFDGQMAGGPLSTAFVLIELATDIIRRDYQLGRAALGI